MFTIADLEEARDRRKAGLDLIAKQEKLIAALAAQDKDTTAAERALMMLYEMLDMTQRHLNEVAIALSQTSPGF